MKKKENELLYGSFFVLKLSIVTFRPQAPHKTARSHLPHDRTTGSSPRPPYYKGTLLKLCPLMAEIYLSKTEIINCIAYKSHHIRLLNSLPDKHD
jgi:hypothetical protein